VLSVPMKGEERRTEGSLLAQTATAERWSARPLQAACVRAFAFLAPIAVSIAFVHIVSRAVPAPTSSWWLFLLWWGLLSGLATGVLVGADRLSRRLLPLAALLKLSLVFPDRAPSRFRTALRAGTVETLEQRIDKASAAGRDGGPMEAAERLLELVAALDAHDKLTRGHAERVRAYSQMIADELRLGKEDRDLLNWAALLHDIGKLGVPSEILTKPGRLTEEEFAAIKRHPELGAELVAPLRSWLGEWVEAVRDHHERWDGKGYPRGRAGDEITLGGRVVAVADVFDVITSARSYKDASSTIEARKELARNAGSQFDERIVRAFLGVSLGRLRFAMGPLAWLAHLPVLGRVPLTPAVSSLSGALAVVAAAATTGLVVEPAPGRAAEAGAPAVERSAAAQPSPERSAAAQPATERSSAAQPPAAASPGPSARPARTAPAAPTDEFARTPSPARAAAPVADVPPPSPAPTADSLEPPAHPAAVQLAPSVASFVDEDSAVVIDLFGITASKDVATLRISAPPHVGRSQATPEHAIFYRPPLNYHGRTTIGYEVCWRDDRCALGLARITVRPVNDAPRATDDVVDAEEDTPVAIDVLANDSDVDEEPLRISSVTGETHGNAIIRDGDVRWSAPPNFHGRASFVYRVEDPDGASGTGRVTVAVNPVNDVPRAASDSASTQEDVPVRIGVLANDSDLDGDVLKVRDVAAPGTGSVSYDAAAVTYSPPPDFSGTTTFTYGVSDGNGGSATGTVEVSVAPVNDAPRALDDAVSVLENASITIDVLGNDGDPEGDAISLTSFSQPSIGNAVRDGDRVLFTAPASAGSTSFEYVVGDAHGASGHGVVSITVVGINSPPSFTGGPDQAVLEDAGVQSVAGWAQAITPGPADESGQSVTFLVTNTNNALFAAGGQPTVAGDGTLTYTTAANATGSASVTVRARDDGGTANGGSDTSPPYTFTIAVSNVNDSPTAAADSASVNEDASAGVTFGVLGNDTDPDPADLLSVASYDASGVKDGTLTHVGAGLFTFVPDPGFSGSETFSYTVVDGNGGMDTAGVTIVVTPQPDVPVAADDAYATPFNTAVVRAAPGVLANDADEDEDALTLQTTPVTAPSNGSLTLSADGSFAYTPNFGFVGTDTFTYRVSDGTGLTDDAAVTITVSLTSATSVLYLGASGPSADIYDLTTSPPAPASPVPDFDGDGEPGLTIKNSNGDESEPDPRKWHTWARPVSLVPLVLNGPVTLQLWSSVDGFDPDDDLHPHVFLYDCLIGGLACVRIAETHAYVPNWNGGSSTWVYREITIGSVDRTIILGRELRVRLQTSQNDLWVAMTAAFPSALAVTTP
jgi:putative nucleotidyltransferase with HDIG domain